jgi:hypothetical protein
MSGGGGTFDTVTATAAEVVVAERIPATAVG